jgi:hypothetical protein
LKKIIKIIFSAHSVFKTSLNSHFALLDFFLHVRQGQLQLIILFLHELIRGLIVNDLVIECVLKLVVVAVAIELIATNGLGRGGRHLTYAPLDRVSQVEVIRAVREQIVTLYLLLWCWLLHLPAHVTLLTESKQVPVVAVIAHFAQRRRVRTVCQAVLLGKCRICAL